LVCLFLFLVLFLCFSFVCFWFVCLPFCSNCFESITVPILSF
jgi:hypothetical protein